MKGDDPRDCPFCDYKGPSRIQYRSPYVYAIEPIEAVTDGHLLVIPWSHFRDFTEEPMVTALVMGEAAKIAQRQFGQSFNLITSKGEEATQTIAHFHVHLVPRFDGDGLTLPWS